MLPSNIKYYWYNIECLCLLCWYVFDANKFTGLRQIYHLQTTDNLIFSKHVQKHLFVTTTGLKTTLKNIKQKKKREMWKIVQSIYSKPNIQIRMNVFKKRPDLFFYQMVNENIYICNTTYNYIFIYTVMCTYNAILYLLLFNQKHWF